MSLSTDEYRVAVAALHMSGADFGRLIGVDERTERRWALGEARVPGPVVMILRLLIARPELLEVARQLEPPVVRKRATSRQAP